MRDSVGNKKYINYSTPQEVGANSFTSTLGVLCEKNNLFGLYVKQSNFADPDLDEMYFICGLDENTVRKAHKNVVEEYKDQERKVDKFKLLHVTKLTGASPFSSYLDVANFCLHASTIRGLCNKYGFNKQFDEISPGFITTLEAAYLDSLKPCISTFERRQRDDIVRELLNTQGEREFKKEKSEIPKIENVPLKSDIVNMVSISELMFKNNNLSKLVACSQSEVDKLLLFFKNNPDILFYQAKSLEFKFDVSDDRMFGSKEGNTFYSCMFMYPTTYDKVVDLEYLKIHSNPTVKFSPPIEFVNSEICSFGIAAQNINSIFKLASEKNIPLWIDPERLYYSCNPAEDPETIKAGYRINGALSMQKEIDLLLNEYAVGFSTKRILSYDDFNRYNKNNPDVLTYEEYRKNTYGV